MEDDDRLSSDYLKAIFKAYDERCCKEYVVECQILYETTQNPLWVWDAWRMCREYNFSVPEWINNYLDASAKALLKLAVSDRLKEETKETLGYIANAFGMVNSQGSRSQFAEFRNQKRNILMVYEVWTVEEEIKIKKIVKNRGENKYEIVEKRIKENWDTWKEYFPKIDPEKESPISAKRIGDVFRKEIKAREKRMEYIKKNGKNLSKVPAPRWD